MSLAKAKTFLRDIGMTIAKRDDEYQVNFASAKDDRATYYTNDLDDAVSTAIFMAYHEALHETQSNRPRSTGSKA